MSKKRKPDQRGDILTALTATLDSASGPVAIGLDMAAQEGEWGVCILALDESLSHARLCTLVPQAKLNNDHSRSPTLLFRPSLDLIDALLAAIRDRKHFGSLAVDTPFGWSCSQRRFLNGWSAVDGWQAPQDDIEAALPSSVMFARRRCDLALNTAFPRIQPLAVGADKIALATVAWAIARRRLDKHLGTIDIGLDNRGPGFFTFETYPAAFVKLVAGDFGDYKSVPKVRAKLLEHLHQKYSIDLGEQGEECLVWATTQRGSPNAYDAFLSALSAWDHIRWRANPTSVSLSTPELLLGCAPEQNVVNEIRKEGWILVRTK